MKKAIVVSAYNYYDVRMRYVCSLLSSSGYNVTYYVQSFNHYTKEQLSKCDNNAILIKTVSYKHNVSLRRLISCIIFSHRVYKEIKRNKPEFVYSIIPPNSLSYYLWKGKKKLNYRLVLDIIDSWPESLPIGSKVLRFFASPLLHFWKYVRNASIIHADRIIGVSNSVFSVIHTKNVQSKVFYPLPRSKGELILDFYWTENELSFCYLGGINKIVNIERIISILSEINKRKKVSLFIIGKGERKKDFISQAKMCSIDVIDYGVLYAWEDKKRIFSKCTFGLNIPNTEVKVTMSLKGAEYLCASLPMVNEAEGDTELLIEKYGAGINTRDKTVRTIANIICLYKKEDIISMRKNAYFTYVNEFESKNKPDLLF